MNSIVWWSTLSLVVTAAVTDVRSRRIPNGLVIPFLAAGLIFALERLGLSGLTNSLEGIALAIVPLGALCWLRAMGMGDLKLCAAVGAWVGVEQLGVALVVTAVAGGVMAILWAVLHAEVGSSIDGASDLVFGFPARGFRPHSTLTLDNPRARTMPWAPAIAIGTIFSFFC